MRAGRRSSPGAFSASGISGAGEAADTFRKAGGGEQGGGYSNPVDPPGSLSPRTAKGRAV